MLYFRLYTPIRLSKARFDCLIQSVESTVCSPPEMPRQNDMVRRTVHPNLELAGTRACNSA